MSLFELSGAFAAPRRPRLAIGILLGMIAYALAGATTVWSQQRFLRNYSTEDGLVQSQVKAILQDRRLP